MGKLLDKVIDAISDLEFALAELCDNGDEDLLYLYPYEDLASVLGCFEEAVQNKWWMENKDGDILQAEYQEYLLDSAGIPDKDILSFKEWGKKRFYNLHPLK